MTDVPAGPRTRDAGAPSQGPPRPAQGSPAGRVRAPVPPDLREATWAPVSNRAPGAGGPKAGGRTLGGRGQGCARSHGMEGLGGPGSISGSGLRIRARPYAGRDVSDWD